MGKDDSLSITLPRLNTANYRVWSKSVVTYLGTKKISYLTNYTLEDPILLEEDEDQEYVRPILQILRCKMSTKQITDKWIARLPTDLRREIADEPAAIQWFHVRSRDIPRELITLCIHGAVLIINTKLYRIFDDIEKFGEARDRKIVDEEKAKTIILCTMSHDLKHMFESKQNIREGWENIKKFFGKDSVQELRTVKHQMRELKFLDLGTYLREFNKLLSEFEYYGGRRDIDEVLETFLVHIPSEKYGTEKRIFDFSNVDEAIEKFREIFKKEMPTKKGQSATTMRKQTRIQKISTKDTTQRKAGKCYSCGGYGHIAKECATKQKVCHHCGSLEHTKNEP